MKYKRVWMDYDSEMWLARPYALKPTIAARPQERAIARSITARLAREPLGDANADLLGDVFFSLYKSDDEFIPEEGLPVERSVNKALIEWMQSSANYNQQKLSSVGNIAASLISSVFMWEFLSTEEALQEAIKKQEEAERAMQEAMQAMRDSAAAATGGNQAGAAKLQQHARNKQDAAKALARQAKRRIDAMKKSPVGQGMMGSALKQAQEKGEEISDIMAGWGIDPGSAEPTDIQEILKIVNQYGDKLREIAKLAGRLKEAASRGVEESHRSYSGPVTEVNYIRDFQRIFATERLKLSKRMHPLIRVPAVVQFLRHGLLGWQPFEEAKQEGSFVAMVDGSGSMYGGLEEIAKGVALGIAGALTSDKSSVVDRHFMLTTFGAERDPFRDVSDKDPWQERVRWASDMPGGGTDFDNAFAGAMDRMKKMAKDGIKGIDLFFITDGWASLSDQSIRDWRDFVDETGAKLLYVNIGSRVNDEVKALADVMIQVDNAEDFNGKSDEIAFTIANKITGADYERREAGGD